MTKNNFFPIIKEMIRIIEYGREQICSLLFPLRCPVCDDILSPEDKEKGIHKECESKFFPVEGAVCMHCGRPLGLFSSQEKINFIKPFYESEYSKEYCYECLRKGRIRQEENNAIRKKQPENATMKISNITQAKALYLYKGAIKKTMYRFKYNNKREYAEFFAKKAMEKYGDWIKAEMIVPVPMYRKKERLRGYNQATVFAEELSRLIDIPVDAHLVKRIKNTVAQKGLNDIERENNLKNAFQIEKSIVKYNCVLIIDDIFTTGSTAEAVAKELKKRGVHQIYFLSICIGGDT